MKKPKKRSAKRVALKKSANREMLQAAKALAALDTAYHERRQKYSTFVESIRNLPTLERAEAWLSYVSSELEDFGDQEALVYLSSRGIDCSKQIADLIAWWKDRENDRLSQYIREPIVWDSGKLRPKKVPTRKVVNSSEIEKLSPFVLRDFWGGSRYQEQTIDATMLRTVSWCGIGGFEPWWKRLARQTADLFRHGGLERPYLAFWIFAMCRSDYAISLMRRTLERSVDDNEMCEYLQDVPWTFDWDLNRSSVVHIPTAAAIVFSNHIVRPDKMNGEAVSGAIGVLQKHQNKDGSWPIWVAGDQEPSIEATAMAVHAIALSKPNGYERVLSFAKEYLEGHQNWRGHWDDKDACDITYLTVLVLDALQLSVNSDVLTFSLPSSIVKLPSNFHDGQRRLSGNRRFAVALSFPGEKRYFVEEVANYLSKKLGRERVFYDAYYEAELAKTDLDTILQSVYHDESDLVVVFSCSDYERKEWCGLEWRGIRDIIKQRRGQDVMIVRMDNTMLKGLYSIDGYIDVGKRTPKEIASLILTRLSKERTAAR
jgi:hypothetical protein